MGNEILKITQTLADKDTSAILLVGSEEVGDKVKIETWEDLNMGATARVYAG